jgi:type I site-specific restriction-modification system R (restriction) subunit
VDESQEEQSLRKAHERSKSALRNDQDDKMEALSKKLEAETKKEEAKCKEEWENEKDRVLREKKNRQAAEIAARPDLTQEELAAVCTHTQFIVMLCNMKFKNKCDCSAK